MSKVAKRGRNPGTVDNWLDSLGFYRKNVAYDETCLFRAVSEQLFDCQIYHEKVRKECVDFGRKHYYEFWHILDSEDEWYNHLEMLEKHMVICGNIEIQLISKKYNRDVLIFDATNQQLHNVTKRNLDKTLKLCLMNDDHYDVIFNREHIRNAGFCQSIVYNILYENIFEIPDVPNIVNKMLYDKKIVPLNPNETNNNIELNPTDIDPKPNIEARLRNTPSPPTNIAPFPFKVAKALDPSIYRNIEYDSWTEVRREMRLGEWYYGDDKLILGTRCILNDVENNQTFECYIQEIIKNQNKCVVYITKLAERRLVNYTDLSPENDAKPWPLPYRFSKNLTLTTSPNPPPDIIMKPPKKRNKEKKRSKSSSESSAQSHPVSNKTEAMEQDVKAYVGIPLQMQNSSIENPVNETSSPTPETPHSQHNLLVTPDVSMGKFSWENAPQWNPFIPINPEPVVWPHTAPPYNYGMKPMITSTPVTPDVIPYDPNYPYFCNYQNDYNYQSYQPEGVTQHENVMDYEENQNRPESQHQDYQEQNYECQHERPTLCTNLTTQSKIDMYSPIIPIPPGTPVIYAHPSEMMPPTPVPMYTPPVEMQYMSPAPFIYPPTPPTAWYPPGINSQGFIFSPINQK